MSRGMFVIFLYFKLAKCPNTQSHLSLSQRHSMSDFHFMSQFKQTLRSFVDGTSLIWSQNVLKKSIPPPGLFCGVVSVSSGQA